MWRCLNRLEKVRPLVWINEIPWDEMGPELTLHCTDDFCRDQERMLRRILYQWEHMPCDMIVEGVLYCPLVIHDSGFGIEEKAVRTSDRYGSRHYIPVLRTEADIEKIQMPKITVDLEASERRYCQMAEIYEGIIPVVKRGACGFWFAPWDILCRWLGIEEMFTDMVERPHFLHGCMERLTAAHLARLEQYEAQNLLALNNGYHRVGSGGLGFTDELPQPDFDGAHVRPMDLWGTATAQIFSEVSPAMHEEFALQYERRWLERFGLNCYGCCEPLHHKIGILASIPRLRRISVSPRADVAAAAEAIGDRYVFSLKPNPAVLATDTWRPEVARRELRASLEKARGCRIEVILKDITTVRNEPQRLWEWAEMAMEVVDRLGN